MMLRFPECSDKVPSVYINRSHTSFNQVLTNSVNKFECCTENIPRRVRGSPNCRDFAFLLAHICAQSCSSPIPSLALRLSSSLTVLRRFFHKDLFDPRCHSLPNSCPTSLLAGYKPSKLYLQTSKAFPVLSYETGKWLIAWSGPGKYHQPASLSKTIKATFPCCLLLQLVSVCEQIPIYAYILLCICKRMPARTLQGLFVGPVVFARIWARHTVWNVCPLTYSAENKHSSS